MIGFSGVDLLGKFVGVVVDEIILMRFFWDIKRFLAWRR